MSITKLEAKEAVRSAYEEKKQEWEPGSVVRSELSDMYSKAVRNIDEVDV